MKKTPLLNIALSRVIASLGHGDVLVIGDAGLPVPPGVELIDLALTAVISLTRKMACQNLLPDLTDLPHASAGCPSSRSTTPPRQLIVYQNSATRAKKMIPKFFTILQSRSTT